MKGVRTQRTQRKLSRAVCVTGMLSVFATVSCGDAESMTEENNKEVMATQYAGEYQFHQVVKIRSVFPGTPVRFVECSATAISGAVLLTASQCLFHQNGEAASYVDVVGASGTNKGSIGARSMQIAYSKGYKDALEAGRKEDSLYGDDFGLVMFGVGTFKAVAKMGVSANELRDKKAWQVGYIETLFRRYVRDDIRVKLLSPKTITMQTMSTNAGEQGGPLFVKTSKGYRVAGVASWPKNGDPLTGDSLAAFISPERAKGIMNYSVNVHDYCVTAYDQKGFKGRAWTFCAADSINKVDFVGEPMNTLPTWASSQEGWSKKISSITTGKHVWPKLFKYYERLEPLVCQARRQGSTLDIRKGRDLGPWFDIQTSCLVLMSARDGTQLGAGAFFRYY